MSDFLLGHDCVDFPKLIRNGLAEQSLKLFALEPFGPVDDPILGEGFSLL